jgi:hypothetical protein
MNVQAKMSVNDDGVTAFLRSEGAIYECGKKANHQAAVFPCPDETVARAVII